MTKGRLLCPSASLLMRVCVLVTILTTSVAALDEQKESNRPGMSEVQKSSVTPLFQDSSPRNGLLAAVESSSEPLEDSQYGIWPFNGKNKTDNSCASHKHCFECATSSAMCHWCEFDNACHEVGSVHGCFRGSDCTNHTKPDHPKDKNETSCSSHANCSECALASTFCHWCAHDQACHAIGSVYGCVTGVDCYSNDRCQREAPERIDTLVFPEMGFVPILAILFIGGMCFCCSTLGYCVAGGVKGAYDDLAYLAAQSAPPPTMPATHHQVLPAVDQSHDEEAATQEEGSDEDGNEESTPLVAQPTDSDYHLMADNVAVPGTQSTTVRRAASSHMNCLFTACSMCYVFSLLAIGGFVLGSIRYFPKAPQYNICNDAVAWKSLVDSMTSMKVEANIEILVSVMNPNHFDVGLDMGKGNFKHDGAFVGSFEIPPAQAKAMSITDMMILAKFTPEKWEALSLTAEYYRGTLVLDVDSQASIRVPALANYSYQANFADMRVHVNDPTMMDRHLCACPQWKDVKNKTKPFYFDLGGV